MTSQFMSSTPEEVDAISEKIEKSWSITSSFSFAASISPEATPMPSAAAARPYAMDPYVSAVTTGLPRLRASLTRSVVSAPVLICTKWMSTADSIAASLMAARTPSAATRAWTAVPNSSGNRSRVYAVPMVRRGWPLGVPRSGSRVKIVAWGLMSPSVPPDQMMGTRLAIASTFCPDRSASSSWNDSVASARV